MSESGAEGRGGDEKPPSPPRSRPPKNPPGRRRFGPPWPEEAGRRGPGDIGPLRATLAVCRLAGAIAALLVIAAGTALLSPFMDTGGPSRPATGWRKASARLILLALGLRLRELGPRPRDTGRGRLVVANHVSWVDALALGAASGAVFVAYERAWPLVGWLMRRFGTVAVPRGATGGLGPAVRAAADRLAAGAVVGAFPEGTTSFGPGVLELKPAFFQAAADAGAALSVAAIRYRTRPAEPSPARVVHWVDWTPLIVHAYRLAAAAPAELELRWLATIETRGRNRRSLAAEAEGLMQGFLVGGAEASPPAS